MKEEIKIYEYWRKKQLRYPYKQLDKQHLQTELDRLIEEYNEFKQRELALDMSRGKPNSEQLDLAMGMLDSVHSNITAVSESGFDCRNYGNMEGIPEVRRMFSDMLGVPSDQIIVGGNSSLNMMFDTICRAVVSGVHGSVRPWGKESVVKFLCPAPGYDRHFAICEYFNIVMIPIEMTNDGPNMAQVSEYANNDPMVKGIWCVPKYSNPTGVTYSDEVLQAFADLRPAAPDFRIMYDNAYAVHDVSSSPDVLGNLYEMLLEQGKEDMIMIFTSTSKMSFSGGGVSAMAASVANMEHIKKQLGVQIISYDKMSQLMHARFFKDFYGIQAHMKRHADLLSPKFDLVGKILNDELAIEGVAHWTKPNGGYFISLDTSKGCAKRTVQLCKEAGVVLTDAGATFPYGNDPNDSNIRIAPSYPTVEELEDATHLLALAVKIAAAEKLLDL